jgi:membrane protease YdiL (CAAX protease family)
MTGDRNKHRLAMVLVAAFILLILIPIPIAHEIAFTVSLYRNHLWLLVLLVAVLLGGFAWGIAHFNQHQDKSQL